LSKLFKILALDTATDACSVALYLNGKILERQMLAPKRHTEILLSMVAEVLNEANIHLQDLDAFSFGRGPGSFTGIRIAASVIQGLAFGLEKPVIPISTLRALAQGAYRKEGIKAVFAHLDARMEEVYWGLFKIDEQGIMQPVIEERVESPKQIEFPKDVFVSVTGYPMAEDIVRLAVEDYAKEHFVNASEALPLYLRDDVVKKPV
jgi:tRNA threonylcarbamoyladenosine biosynthesis protein TsaB